MIGVFCYPSGLTVFGFMCGAGPVTSKRLFFTSGVTFDTMYGEFIMTSCLNSLVHVERPSAVAASTMVSGISTNRRGQMLHQMLNEQTGMVKCYISC